MSTVDHIPPLDDQWEASPGDLPVAGPVYGPVGIVVGSLIIGVPELATGVDHLG